MSRVHCLECDGPVVLDPRGVCPEGHHVGASGASVEHSMGQATAHHDEPEPWVYRIEPSELPLVGASANGTGSAGSSPNGTPPREARPLRFRSFGGEDDGGDDAEGSLRELHALAAFDHQQADTATQAGRRNGSSHNGGHARQVLPPSPQERTDPAPARAPRPDPDAIAEAFAELSALDAPGSAMTPRDSANGRAQRARPGGAPGGSTNGAGSRERIDEQDLASLFNTPPDAAPTSPDTPTTPLDAPVTRLDTPAAPPAVSAAVGDDQRPNTGAPAAEVAGPPPAPPTPPPPPEARWSETTPGGGQPDVDETTPGGGQPDVDETAPELETTELTFEFDLSDLEPPAEHPPAEQPPAGEPPAWNGQEDQGELDAVLQDLSGFDQLFAGPDADTGAANEDQGAGLPEPETTQRMDVPPPAPAPPQPTPQPASQPDGQMPEVAQRPAPPDLSSFTAKGGSAGRGGKRRLFGR